MGTFAARGTRRPDGLGQASGTGPDQPPCLAVVAQAQAAGSGSVEACAAAGRALAESGASLGEALDGLWSTSTTRPDGREPTYDEVRALATGWEDHTLSFLHRLSCADPMTGLASQAHVRARLGELYRAGGEVAAGHALVVVDDGPGGGSEPFAEALRLTRLGETVRAVFAGGDTLARLGPGRLVVLTDLGPRLGARVDLLRRMLGHRPGAHVWCEPLPDRDAAAARLLDELVRL